MTMTFGDLAINDTFNWDTDTPSAHCRKLSTNYYCETERPEGIHRVGSVLVEVYRVGEYTG